MDMRAIFMGLAFAFMWSSAFTSARIIVQDASPLASLSFRFLISGILGIAIAKALGQTWHLTRAQWRATILFGICQNALYLGFNFVAMQTVEASLAAIIASSLPLLVALAGWVIFREKLSPRAVTGLLAGFAGVGLIMGSRLSGGVDLQGVVYCVLGALALTFATLAVRGASSGGNVLMIVGLQMIVGAVVLAVAAAVLEDVFVTPTWPLALAFAYTTLVPGLLATWVWFMLVNRIGAVRAATFHFLNPFFGVAVAAVLLRESLGPLDLVGVGIITVAILVVQLERQRPKPVRPGGV
ncbi:DMT family transporter [Ovoidimarina sediminis]|uniref:DMT family transporter n=1 Tax=Ovoidimarina sediminis TaxID=3079856 RepID=UPI002909740F|nr:DMT family transporter [Rhodophyticola sp. MJ-SS7]MDU8942339.1 DMT family transporter [Rhodophyticola sp. MJ-SS7]